MPTSENGSGRDASRGLPIIFPVHPRTAKIIESIYNPEVSSSHQPIFPPVSGQDSPSAHHYDPEFLSLSVPPSLSLIEPLGYLEFNYLVENAKVVITDSGGITEETTVMGIPCITLRNNTERPETVSIGTNELIGTDPSALKPAMDRLFAGEWKKGSIPELWDGKAAERILGKLIHLFT